MKVDGACHCGAIAYEAEIDPQKVGICHCADCQALSASAFRTIAVAPGETFRVTRGVPKEYVKTAESGRQRIQAFCGVCGSGLYATDVGDNPATYNIRTGTLTQRHDLPPAFECWRDSAMGWQPPIEGTAKFGKSPA